MERLPNIFESYYQPENKLTFAFLQTLSVDCQLAQAFLRWGVPKLPVARGPISIYAQRKPAVGRGFRADDPEVDPTVPDGWLRAFETLVALEVKRDPGLLRGSQLRGHLKALARRDARHKALLILTPDREEPADVVGIAGDARDCGITLCWKPWQAVHSWACDQIASGRAGEQAKGSFLLRSLREYLEMSELSAFAGFVFDQGYDSRRARALLVALRQELSEDVGRLYPELNHGKEKLAGQEESAWDVFAKAKNFTLDPHFTLVISENGPQFCLTVPDKARSAWNRLSGLARERSVRLLFEEGVFEDKIVGTKLSWRSSLEGKSRQIGNSKFGRTSRRNRGLQHGRNSKTRSSGSLRHSSPCTSSLGRPVEAGPGRFFGVKADPSLQLEG